MARRGQRTNDGSTQVEEMIEVELSQSELVTIGKDHAEVLNAIDVMTEQHKAVKKKLKLEAENAEEKERDLRTAIATGKQARPVACTRTPDYKKGIAEIRRNDDDKLVRTEKLSDDERQTHIDDKLGAPPAGEPPDDSA